MFQISKSPTLPVNSEEEVGEVDEPPDDSLSSLRVNPASLQPQQKPHVYTKSAPPPMDRKESLLTRALMTIPHLETQSPLGPPVSGNLSRASTFSNASMPSTAELTSDADDTSPARSSSPSPPSLSDQHHPLHNAIKNPILSTNIPHITNNGQEELLDAGPEQSAIEANLGRKRQITFACATKPASKEALPAREESATAAQPPKRKCMLTFACPARPQQKGEHALGPLNSRHENGRPATGDGVEPPKTQLPIRGKDNLQSRETAKESGDNKKATRGSHTSAEGATGELPEASPFLEFATTNGHDDAWVYEPIDSQRKLTLSDCMRQENNIRKIGQEAEEEAEKEQKDQDNSDDENDDGDHEDDFAPSDDGNESDNEAGFADSDDDSDTESDDQFWVPPSVIAAPSTENVASVRPLGSRARSGSSLDSLSEESNRLKSADSTVHLKHRPSKVQHLRPGTPELPDSTDFVCGTLDEDRPLEAAYISCREQKKREKYVPIPQDIDPSFPTTDPEDIDEEEDEDLDGPEDHLWLKDQLEGFDDDGTRARTSRYEKKKAGLRSPGRAHSPPPAPTPLKHGVHRSPPPPRQIARRASPAPRGRLFVHSPKRLRSPPPPMRLRSPPGTRRQSPADMVPFATRPAQGLLVGGLAQRPHMTRTSSLPRTPNPFFHNYHARTQQNARVAFGEVTPGRELHVRGPVDIVIGLEKKRQKRKEKFWRQHCRRAAKEQAERKPIPGKGAERMRELGLECAERTRGYGLGQQPPLVISL